VKAPDERLQPRKKKRKTSRNKSRGATIRDHRGEWQKKRKGRANLRKNDEKKGDVESKHRRKLHRTISTQNHSCEGENKVTWHVIKAFGVVGNGKVYTKRLVWWGKKKGKRGIPDNLKLPQPFGQMNKKIKRPVRNQKK